MPHVLCILNDLVTADGVLEAGYQLARRLRYDVRVLRPRPESDPSFMPTEEVMTLERQTAFDRQEDAQTEGFARLVTRHHGLSASVTLDEVRGDVAEIVRRAAAGAVMVVVGAAIGDNRVVAAACIQSLLKGGYGAIVVPAEPVATIGIHPAIYWEEASQAEEAIESAMPVLLSADRVDVLVCFNGRQPDAPPSKLVERLRGQGLATSVTKIDVGGRHQGQALLDRARTLGCDLLVMGAHSENWLHDALVGSISSDVLSDIKLPVLMQS